VCPRRAEIPAAEGIIKLKKITTKNLPHSLQKCTIADFDMPKLISVSLFKQFEHLFELLPSIMIPHKQHGIRTILAAVDTMDIQSNLSDMGIDENLLEVIEKLRMLTS
jgi:hypothetical protein